MHHRIAKVYGIYCDCFSTDTDSLKKIIWGAQNLVLTENENCPGDSSTTTWQIAYLFSSVKCGWVGRQSKALQTAFADYKVAGLFFKQV